MNKRNIVHIASDKKNGSNKRSNNEKNNNNYNENKSDDLSVQPINFNLSSHASLTLPVPLPFSLPLSPPFSLPLSLPNFQSTNIADLRISRNCKDGKKRLNLLKSINNNKIKLKSITIKNTNKYEIFDESHHFEKENNSSMLSEFSTVLTRPLSSSLPQSLPSLNNESRDSNIYNKLENNHFIQKIEENNWFEELKCITEISPPTNEMGSNSSLPSSASFLTKGIIV